MGNKNPGKEKENSSLYYLSNMFSPYRAENGNVNTVAHQGSCFKIQEPEEVIF
jgi:hypothetical protein